ncbi:Pyr-redox-2 domain-containing protein [Mycena chlorophos]|uniref:Pyr-redox-2 domain-containing protein n=1 Tax=Mycena chlorophos TaxID=658473 RepID=A0A8H6S3G2_MYCCL|nr:Pyr-redox-2 domain-containing protein [Mycena chlorophos]
MTLKTVVVLGASFAGAKAAQRIATGLPANGWRIVLVERNSHVNHPYVLPRFSVLPGHEHKAFIPTDNIFNVGTPNPNPQKYISLQATVQSISSNAITLSRSFPEHDIPTTKLPFDCAVYALGSHLPPPLALWESGKHFNGTKAESIAWLKRKQDELSSPAITSVLVVGGGALGIQFATDIAAVHPDKRVTLLHSRERLLPRYKEAMHDEILAALREAKIEVILGERLQITSASAAGVGGVVHTSTGREISVDLVLLCTGQRPNTEILSAFDSTTVDPQTGLAQVEHTMQLVGHPHIFVVGDAADAFGAIAAGWTADAQAQVAAANVLKLICNDCESELVEYQPPQPAIKVSLGLHKNVIQHSNGGVSVGELKRVDFGIASMWRYFGWPVHLQDGQEDSEELYK